MDSAAREGVAKGGRGEEKGEARKSCKPIMGGDAAPASSGGELTGAWTAWSAEATVGKGMRKIVKN